MTELVDHPKHYNSHPSGIEAIDVAEGMTFNIGNILKYLWRMGHKDAQSIDMKKAIWYARREIDLRKRIKKDPLNEDMSVGMMKFVVNQETDPFRKEVLNLVWGAAVDADPLNVSKLEKLIDLLLNRLAYSDNTDTSPMP